MGKILKTSVLRNMSYVNKIEAWLTYSPASVVIYPKKYNPAAISGEVSYLRPSYRAFMSDNNGGGTAGIMPVNATTVTNIASYRGTVTSPGGAPSLYSLLESEWIAAGNNNDDAPSTVTYANALSNFSVNTTQFESWSAAATPAQTGIRLASMPHAVIEAVLEDKRRIYGGKGKGGFPLRHETFANLIFDNFLVKFVDEYKTYL